MIYSKVVTFEPSGYITAANANHFQAQLSAVINAPDYSVLLVDMERVDFLDSSGLMVLVSAFRQTQQLGKRLIVCSISPSVRMIFELTQLDRIFEIFENRETFHTSFGECLAA
jgi:anti-anti-sigma factor